MRLGTTIDLGANILPHNGDNGLKDSLVANNHGILSAETNDDLANNLKKGAYNAGGEGRVPEFYRHMCTIQVLDNSTKTDKGGKGNEMAILLISNVQDDWEPKRLLEDLGVRLVYPRGRPLRGVVDSRDVFMSGKCLSKGMRELLSLRSDVNYD